MQTFKNTARLIEQIEEDSTVSCLCPTVLDEHAAFFKAAFPGEIAYAVKANPAPPLLEGLTKAGIRYFDVASIPEIKLLREIQPKAVLLYDNPVKSRREIREAYFDYQVRSFAIDDARELAKIHEEIGDDANLEISVRFSVGQSTAVYDLSKKFGVNETTAIELLKQINALGYRAALTFHPGSQIVEVDAYNGHIAAAAKIERKSGVAIQMLNVGGGFPTAYLNSGAPQLKQIFDQIKKHYETHFTDRDDVLLVCEPGRSMADPSISVLTQVKLRREEPIIFINNGLYGDFMEQLHGRLELPTRVFRDGQLLQGPTEKFTVFGPTCDSLDVFSYEVPLPSSITEGDWIEFGQMGGYGSSTGTQFNGYESGPYVLVEEGFTDLHR